MGDVLVAIGNTLVANLPDKQDDVVATRSRLQQVTQWIAQASRPLVLTFLWRLPRPWNKGNEDEKNENDAKNPTNKDPPSMSNKEAIRPIGKRKYWQMKPSGAQRLYKV